MRQKKLEVSRQKPVSLQSTAAVITYGYENQTDKSSSKYNFKNQI